MTSIEASVPEVKEQVVPDKSSTVALPVDFLAYMEILRCADPEGHDALGRELAAADPGPARVEAAAHKRRASMLASLQGALDGAALGIDLRDDRDRVCDRVRD